MQGSLKEKSPKLASNSSQTEVKNDNDADIEKATKDLARVDALYQICLRDYFSTFAAYATATTILLATVGFIVVKDTSPLVVTGFAMFGIFLCFQWHIATSSMRDQYRHFYHRMVKLEEEIGSNVMRRWRDAANLARNRKKPLDESVSFKDKQYLTWSFRQIGRPWGLRGTSVPVIYSSVFLSIGLSLGVLKYFYYAGAYAAGLSIVWLILGNYLVYIEERKASLGPNYRNKKVAPVE